VLFYFGAAQIEYSFVLIILFGNSDMGNNFSSKIARPVIESSAQFLAMLQFNIKFL